MNTETSKREPGAVAPTRSTAAVRRAIRRSLIPARAWAEALGCSKRALNLLLAGDSRVTGGPMVARAAALLDALRDGRSRWLKLRTPGRPGHPTYEMVGVQFTPAAVETVLYKVDFLHGSLARVPTGPVREDQLWPCAARSRAGGLIGAFFPDAEVVGPSGPVRRFPPRR